MIPTLHLQAALQLVMNPLIRRRPRSNQSGNNGYL